MGLASWGLVVCSPALAQGVPRIEEVDLSEEDTLAVEVQAPDIESEELSRLVLEADSVFASADRPLSLTLYGHLVDILDARRETTGLDEEELPLLVHALARRAELHMELGQEDLAAEGLRHLLEVSPDAQLPTVGPDAVSAELSRRFERVRNATVGEIQLILEPYDTQVWVDERRVDANETVVALAGLHVLRLRRPGHTPIDRQLQVTAGRSVSLELMLERTSPVLRLNTRPRGAAVSLDGIPHGVTDGTADEGFLPQGATGVYRRDEFSDELVIEGLEPGLRILTVEKEGFRPYRMELQILDPIDYQMPPIVLEPENGQMVFVNFPRDGQILVDGQRVEPDVPGTSRPRVTLPPGTYRVTVMAGGAARMFSTDLTLSDRQTVEIEVKLNPGLALVGVLGGERGRAANVLQSMQARLGESAKWAVVDRVGQASEALSLLGLSADRLRDASSPAAAQVDWREVQETLDQSAPGLLYILAVLDNDLLATSADLWIWPAGPGPAVPDRLTLPLGDPEALRGLRRRLDQPIPLRRSWLGALAIDSNASAHPVIADVTPAGPAEAADIRPGDEILGIGGVPVQSRAQLETRVAAAESGEKVEIALRTAGQGRTVSLRLGASPSMEVGNPRLLPSVAWADLVLLSEEAKGGDKWLVFLDQGLLQLRAKNAQAAVAILRGIRAPQTSHGLGQAAVDYWLGIALSRSGRDFREAARQSLEKAAALPGARLEHNDGPYLQPRARARLRLLGTD